MRLAAIHNTLFFGHLALEKMLKALVVKQTAEHAPFTHSLPLLMSKLIIEIPEEIKLKLAGFMEFYFEARNPEEQKGFYARCTREFAQQKLREIKEIFQWLKGKL